MSLKSAHYQAMQGLNLTDEEIEKDWEQVCKDLGIEEVRLDELPEDFFKNLDLPF